MEKLVRSSCQHVITANKTLLCCGVQYKDDPDDGHQGLQLYPALTPHAQDTQHTHQVLNVFLIFNFITVFSSDFFL
jgi:hypothetical protein